MCHQVTHQPSFSSRCCSQWHAIGVLSYITYKKAKVLVRYLKPGIEGGTEESDGLPNRIKKSGQYFRENLVYSTGKLKSEFWQLLSA